MKRRKLIIGAGSSAIALLAGCSSSDGQTTADSPTQAKKPGTTTETETTTTTAQSTPTPSGKITKVDPEENEEYGELNEIKFAIDIENPSKGDEKLRVTVESEAGKQTKETGLFGNEQTVTVTPPAGTNTDGTTVYWIVELVKEGEVVDTKSGKISGYET